MKLSTDSSTSTPEIHAPENLDLFPAPLPPASPLRPASPVDERPLEAVAADINRAHEEAQQYAGRAVERALQAGDLLLSVKARLNHGEFGPWCDEHLPAISQRQLQKYMKAARQLPRPKGRGLQLYSPHPFGSWHATLAWIPGHHRETPEAIGPIDTSSQEDSCEWRPHLPTRHWPVAAVSGFLTEKKAVGGFSALKTVYPVGALTH